MLFDYFGNSYDSYNFEKERREHWLRLERDAKNWVFTKPFTTLVMIIIQEEEHSAAEWNRILPERLIAEYLEDIAASQDLRLERIKEWWLERFNSTARYTFLNEFSSNPGRLNYNRLSAERRSFWENTVIPFVKKGIDLETLYQKYSDTPLPTKEDVKVEIESI